MDVWPLADEMTCREGNIIIIIRREQRRGMPMSWQVATKITPLKLKIHLYVIFKNYFFKHIHIYYKENCHFHIKILYFYKISLTYIKN